jgi:hypothetical protein
MSAQSQPVVPRIDLYDLLQISPSAHPDVVHAAYRELIYRYQGEVAEKPGSAKILRQVNAAYAVLRDEGRRARYDAYRLRDTTLTSRSAPRPYLAAPALERVEPVPQAPRSTRTAAILGVLALMVMLSIATFTVDIFDEPSVPTANTGKAAGVHKRTLGSLIIDATRLMPGPCGPQFPGPINPC